MVEVKPGGRCPVAVFDNAGGKRPPMGGHEEFDVLRQHGGVFQVEEGNGFVFQAGLPFLLVTKYEEILQVCQNPQVFSNDVVKDLEGVPTLIPEYLDGDIHVAWRRLLARDFSPGAVKALDGEMRVRVNDLIDSIIDKGECDFIEDFSLKYPTAIFLTMMGLDLANMDQYIQWVTAILHPDPANLMHAFETQAVVMEHFRGVIAEKRAAAAAGASDPGLVSKALQWEINGEKISDEDLLSFCLLLFQAGLDTVTAELGYAFYHLATHPEHRQRIVEDPAVIPRAVEEYLRMFGMVSPPRITLAESMIGDCPVVPGDRVAVGFPSAGRDEAVFGEDSLVVDFDRVKMNHLGFGAGPHRCLGSNLARREMIIALEEWHKRIPEYSLTPGVTVDENISEIHGLNNVPLTWKA